MKKTNANKRKLSTFVIAFIAVAVLFLAFGFGTLGSVRTVGENFELKAPVTDAAGSEQRSTVVFQLAPSITETYTDSNGKEATRTVNLLVDNIYVFVSAIYAEPGKAAGLSVRRSTSPTQYFTGQLNATLENIYSVPAEGQDGAKGADVTDVLYNWVAPFSVTSTWRVSSSRYCELSATSANIRISEVVFVGRPDGTANREKYVIAAEISSATPQTGETMAQSKARASALVDAYTNEQARAYNTSMTNTDTRGTVALPEIPVPAVSSYDRFSKEEVYSLLTITEMKVGGSYAVDDRTGRDNSVYTIDSVYNVLGADILALGTEIFGVSPFGLRFFPMLFSFGILLVGYFFVLRLTKSDRAGFVFALLYALCDISFSLGHIGTPLTAGIFFVLLAAYLCHGFYARGMKKATFAGALPLFFAGVSGAAAICVNGAMVIPVAAVCGLFVAGMIRQQKAKQIRLDAVLAEVPEDPSEEQTQTAKEKAAKTLTEYRTKNLLAGVCYPAALLLFTVIFSLLFIIPVYFPLLKMYDNPVSPAGNVFTYGWKAFAGGFIGSNALGATQSAWNIFYKVFTGAGDVFAVTAVAINTVALLAAVAAVVYAVVRIVKCAKTFDRPAKAELRRLSVPLAGIVVSLVCASFGGGALGFILLAYTFGFMLAAVCAESLMSAEGKAGAVAKGVTIAVLVLLVLCFALLAVFTFSVPLPASFISKFI